MEPLLHLFLSQMNVDISRVLIDNKLGLSESQAKQIKKLRELSAIRYGYWMKCSGRSLYIIFGQINCIRFLKVGILE